MKNYLLLTAVLFSIALASCEKENVEPKTLNVHDTIYVDPQVPSLGEFSYETTFSHVFDIEAGAGTGTNKVQINDTTIRWDLNSLRDSISEGVMVIQGTGEYNITVEYADLSKGIIMGTIWNDGDEAIYCKITGTFRYENNISFDLNIKSSTGWIVKFFLYN